MRIDRAGYPYLACCLVVAALLAAAGWLPGAAGACALAGVFAFFFRDPDRHAPPGERLVLAPADGRVLAAGPASGSGAPSGDWQQVSVFLSPLDVHVNRSPVSGRVERVEYRAGGYLPAYRAEAGSRNHRNEILLACDATRQVVCRQVAGVLVRRVECRLREGQRVVAGDRLGIMKFGSRMDVYLPPDAAVVARIGDRVRAGETVVARLGG